MSNYHSFLPIDLRSNLLSSYKSSIENNGSITFDKQTADLDKDVQKDHMASIGKLPKTRPRDNEFEEMTALPANQFEHDPRDFPIIHSTNTSSKHPVPNSSIYSQY